MKNSKIMHATAAVFLLLHCYEQWQLAKDIFGYHFRYLTQWALHLSVVFHLSFLLPHTRTTRSSLFTTLNWHSTISTVNACVFVFYWLAYSTNPTALIGRPSLTPWQDCVIHGLSPLSTVLSYTYYSSHPLRITYTHITSTLTLLTAYIAWIEFLVRPYSIMPYKILRHAHTGERVFIYALGLAGAYAVHTLLLSFCTKIRLHRMQRHNNTASSLFAKPHST